MKSELIEKYIKLHKLTKDLVDEFKEVGNSKRFNDVFILKFELENRIVIPFERNQEIRDDKLLDIKVKLDNSIDTLEVYALEYQKNKIDKETMSNYLVGSKALDEIKEKMSNVQAKDTSIQTNTNTRKNK